MAENKPVPINDEMIAATRADIERRCQEILARRKKLDEELEQLNRDLYAWEQFERARQHGRPRAETRAPRTTTGKRGQFGPRQAVLDEVRKHPEGISAADVRKALGLGDEKEPRNFVANALSYYKSKGQLTLQNGLYSVA